MTPGQFIVIEGLEGAGKSSAVALCQALIEQAGHEVITVREPGGTPMAEMIRDCVKQPWQEPVQPETELLLMYAARLQLVRTQIQPALNAGTWVIGDRHDLSTQAYQGGGRGIAQPLLDNLRSMTLGDFYPDHTLLLDIEPEVGLQRAKGRGELDRIEQEQIGFFQRTRARYLALSEGNDRIHNIDAMQRIPEVHQAITAVLTEILTP